MKTSEKNALKNLEKAVLESDPDLLKQAFKKVNDQDAALNALTKGLDAARKRLGDFSSSVAEFLLCVDVMRLGLAKLKKKPGKQKNQDRVVIGVVKGDVHDMGKNIVAAIMEACGFAVLDLGRDVDPTKFIQEAEKFQASVLALSTMMSTPLEDMAKTIEMCRNQLPHVKILVGGAPLDEKVARLIGADGYAESAVWVPEKLKQVMKSPDHDEKSTRVFMDYTRRLRVEESGPALAPNPKKAKK